MGNKLKRESEKQVKAKSEELQKVRNAKYLPESKVTMGGADFAVMRTILENVVQGLTTPVYDKEGEMIGYTQPKEIIDLSQALAFVNQLHHKNFEEGVAIPHEQFMKEMEARRKVYEQKKKEEPQAPVPTVEEVSAEGEGTKDSPKVISLK